MFQRVVFEDGIPGFCHLTEFELSDTPEGGVFRVLRSLEDPEVAVAVASPWSFFPDYSAELSEPDRAGLALSVAGEALLLCPVTFDGDQGPIHMNLRAPIVINRETGQGRQILLVDQNLPIRALLPINVSS